PSTAPEPDVVRVTGWSDTRNHPPKNRTSGPSCPCWRLQRELCTGGLTSDQPTRTWEPWLEFPSGRARQPVPAIRVRRLDGTGVSGRLVLMKLTTEGMIRSEHGRGYFITGADDGDV